MDALIALKPARIFAILLLSSPCVAQQASDVSHYAFANYLGSGIYSSAGDSAAVVNIPLSFDIESSSEHSLLLRMPLSLGFFNYNWDELPEGDFPDAVGTVTVTPGIEYHWRASPNLKMETYLDIGFGHNFSDNSNVGILSAGISTLYSFGSETYQPLWVSRFYSAGYRSIQSGSEEHYSALTSGVESGLGWGFSAWERQMEPRLFVAMHWYFGRGELADEFVGALFGESTLELGFSLVFDKPLEFEVVSIERVGFSYSKAGGEDLWRVFFSHPL